MCVGTFGGIFETGSLLTPCGNSNIRLMSNIFLHGGKNWSILSPDLNIYNLASGINQVDIRWKNIFKMTRRQGSRSIFAKMQKGYIVLDFGWLADHHGRGSKKFDRIYHEQKFEKIWLIIMGELSDYLKPASWFP